MSLFSFKDVCQDVTKTATKIPTSEYLEDGKYEIFDQGKSFVAGYTNNSIGIANEFPYIVFGDHTRAIKYVDVPCFIGADGVKLLKVSNSNFVSKYVYYTLLKFPITSQGYSRHFKYLKECVFVERSLEEQNRIVVELDKIQSAIDNKRQQLAKLDELVNSKFYEMFGDPIANPKGWETKPYGDLFHLSAGGTPSKSNASYWENGDISWIGSNLCQDTILYSNDGKYISQLGFENSSAKLFPIGTVLVALVGATIGKTALLQFETTTNQNVLGIQNIKQANYNSVFVFYYTQGLRKYFLEIGDGKFNMASKGFVSKLPMINVDYNLQEQFANFAQKIEQAKDVVSKQINNLQELLDSRMDFYFRQ